MSATYWIKRSDGAILAGPYQAVAGVNSISLVDMPTANTWTYTLVGQNDDGTSQLSEARLFTMVIKR